ncbi:hypothetical protein ACTXT7_003823 [Hymenolepis weldensis]
MTCPLLPLTTTQTITVAGNFVCMHRSWNFSGVRSHIATIISWTDFLILVEVVYVRKKTKDTSVLPGASICLRKLIDDSETNFKDKSRGFNEVYSIGEGRDNASKRTENYQNNSAKISGSRKKVYVCNQRNRHPKLEGAYISSDSSSSSERIDVDELEPIQVKFPDRYTKKPVPPPTSKLEKRTGGRIQSVEAKKEIKYSIPSDKDPDKRRNAKENGKLCSRNATQPPQNRTITTDRPVSFHISNTMYLDLRKREPPEKLEVVKVPLINLIPPQTTSSPTVVDERPGAQNTVESNVFEQKSRISPIEPLILATELFKHCSFYIMPGIERCLCGSNEQSKTTTPKVKAAPTIFPKPSLRSVEVKDLSSEKPNSSNLKSNPFPSPLIGENKKKDTVSSDEISKRKVSEAIKLFERNAAEETAAKKPVENERLPINPTIRHTFHEKGSTLWQGNNSSSSYETTQTNLSQKERRPAGAVAMYTNQGPQLLREMKDRFRTKYGIFYAESELGIQGSLSSSLPTDFSVLSRLDQTLEEAQHLAPLPMNIDNDLSHILPSVLKERPRRAGRPPTKRINSTYSEGSTSTTDV